MGWIDVGHPGVKFSNLGAYDPQNFEKCRRWVLEVTRLAPGALAFYQNTSNPTFRPPP